MKRNRRLLIHIPACLMMVVSAIVDNPRICWRVMAHPQKSSGTTEREKEVARAEFSRNFSSLQNVGYAMRNEHEARTLKPEKLKKYAKAVNKHARTLRGLVTFGELEEPIRESRERLDNPRKFDLSIHRLARLIYAFAHNPVHQNRRVFNTDQARRALVDLETIIMLSKALGSQADSYTIE
jgi:hypothetical protein